MMKFKRVLSVLLAALTVLLLEFAAFWHDHAARGACP